MHARVAVQIPDYPFSNSFLTKFTLVRKCTEPPHPPSKSSVNRIRRLTYNQDTARRFRDPSESVNIIQGDLAEPKGRRQRMLKAMAAELLDYGLLSGLQAQSEIAELLDELYDESLN
jgi:hypothetical protein